MGGKQQEKEAFSCTPDKNSLLQTSKKNLTAVQRVERARCLEPRVLVLLLS